MNEQAPRRPNRTGPCDPEARLQVELDAWDAASDEADADFFEPITFNWDANINRVRNIAREFSRFTKKQ